MRAATGTAAADVQDRRNVFASDRMATRAVGSFCYLDHGSPPATPAAD